MLPIEVKYSSSQNTKFSVTDVSSKLKIMRNYEQPFPFMVFVAASGVAIPNLTSAKFEHGQF